MDPLRPFAALIRSLWPATKARVGHPQRTPSQQTGSSTVLDSQPSASPREVAGRLQPQLAALKSWDAAHARELFVEHVLLAEMGEELAQDPKFIELVQRVSSHLGNEPTISSRLDEVLRDLAAGKYVA